MSVYVKSMGVVYCVILSRQSKASVWNAVRMDITECPSNVVQRIATETRTRQRQAQHVSFRELQGGPEKVSQYNIINKSYVSCDDV